MRSSTFLKKRSGCCGRSGATVSPAFAGDCRAFGEGSDLSGSAAVASAPSPPRPPPPAAFGPPPFGFEPRADDGPPLLLPCGDPPWDADRPWEAPDDDCWPPSPCGPWGPPSGRPSPACEGAVGWPGWPEPRRPEASSDGRGLPPRAWSVGVAPAFGWPDP